MPDAARLAVREDGVADGAPLVLLNSVGSTTDMWSPCLAPLAERFRVVRIDHRGHGDSAPAAGEATVAALAEEVVTTLDALGLERVHLAGLSLGGMVGMRLAIDHPERVGRLALFCTSAYLPPAAQWTERAGTVRGGGMAAVADAVIARWVTPDLAERDPALMALLRKEVEAVDAESYAQCCEAIAAMDLRPDLARIGSPTLAVGGAEDPATPIEHQQAIVDAVPGSRLAVIDGAAHVPTYERPGEVARLLLDHLGEGGSLAAGFATRRAVLGEEYVDAAVARTTPLTRPFQDFITRTAWGDVWTRPELTRPERSIATLAALVTLGAEHELALHVRAARRNGLSDEQIVGVLHHVAVYAGVPRANRAVAIARDVLTETSDRPDAHRPEEKP